MSNDDLRDRMITLMNHLTASYGRYKWLESRTDVPAQKWANLYNERQKPTAELVVALAGVAPNCAEWLITGKAPTRFPEEPWGGVNSELNVTLNVVAPELRQALFQRTYDNLVELEASEFGGLEAFAEGLVAHEEGRPPRPLVKEQLAEMLGRADHALHGSEKGSEASGNQED